MNKQGFKKFVDGPYNTFGNKSKFIQSELSIHKLNSSSNQMSFEERKDVRFKKGRILTAKTNQDYLRTKHSNMMNESTDENLLLPNDKSFN